MPQLARTYRVGAGPDRIEEVIGEHGFEILGADETAFVDDDDGRSLSWSSSRIRQGRIHLVGEQRGASLVRVSVSTDPADDPAEVLTDLVQRLADHMSGADGLEDTAVVLEPDPDAAPGSETTEDQPL